MMKRMLFLFLIYLFLAVQLFAQTQGEIEFPWVPRVSAYEAYVKYKAGKAIILHAGGEKYSVRHITGAIDFDFKPREEALQKFPKKGIEIFTYCY
jgi:hypothetical protein